MKDESGAVKALRAAHIRKQARTTEALTSAISDLEALQPKQIWSKEDLWRAAGLKSGNALKNPAHRTFLSLIVEHNNKLTTSVPPQPKIAEKPSLACVNQELRHQIKVLTSQRDMACNLNGRFQREAEFHASENRDLLKKIKQLQEDRDGWKEKFISNWKSGT